MDVLDNETFIIYDRTVLKKEEDDLKDAIVYFYPPTVSHSINFIMVTYEYFSYVFIVSPA